MELLNKAFETEKRRKYERPKVHSFSLRRKRATTISIVGIVLFLFAYFVPIIYTGNYVAGTARTPALGSEIYGSLTCIVLLHLEGYYDNRPVGFFVAPSGWPFYWRWYGILYEGGHYYFFCNPQTVPVPPA
jgi:hypothetical protein